MKFRPNKQHTGIAIYAFLVIAAAILFYQAVNNIPILMNAVSAFFRFVQPVVFGFVFAYILNPILRLYDNKLLGRIPERRLSAKRRRGLGLLFTYITMLLIIAALVALVLPRLVESIYQLFALIPSYITALTDLYETFAQYLTHMEGINQGTGLESMFPDLIQNITDAMQGLLEMAYTYLAGLIPGILSAGARFTTSLLNLILGIIISIYFLLDREKLFAQTHKITTAIFPQRTRDLLYDVLMDTHRIFSGFITGKLIDSLIIGIICFAGMSILRMPFAVLISVVIGVTNIIPYFGPFIGAIPSALIILIVNPLQALWFLIFVLLLQQFDGNILGPKILGDSTGLSALWVIFAIMLFGGLFGVLGMFIGVPLFAIIYNIIRRLISYLLRRKNLSDNTRHYASDKNPLIK